MECINNVVHNDWHSVMNTWIGTAYEKLIDSLQTQTMVRILHHFSLEWYQNAFTQSTQILSLLSSWWAARRKVETWWTYRTVDVESSVGVRGTFSNSKTGQFHEVYYCICKPMNIIEGKFYTFYNLQILSSDFFLTISFIDTYFWWLKTAHEELFRGHYFGCQPRLHVFKEELLSCILRMRTRAHWSTTWLILLLSWGV